MKKLFTLFLVLLVGSGSSMLAQDCTLYIPNTVGTVLHYQMTNSKGKTMGSYTQKMISIKNKGGETVFEMLQTYIDPKSEESILKQDTLRFRCKGNVFYIDMDKYLNQKQMESFQDMEVKITSEDLVYPPKLSAGQQLKDGSITIEVQTEMMKISMTTKIVNRKVEAVEDMKTTAGNFNCYKISEDVQSKMGFVNMKLHNVSWISKDLGMVRSESYNKKGKLDGITQLVKIER
ncbi:TapB family protein [Ancylomarina longa]|uniref:DUF3108 domain-containing protein n=1 Tax=Ancylomarina longa TaxID=2487017 RepID=A0A434AW72_9BACT|nr:hypothetical protein [Ancylomarina longa]RUT78755.1 hypothetical protein DLK05_06345 [Ancylomarina longa]